MPKPSLPKLSGPRKEHFRGVVWPRQSDTVPPKHGPDGPVYRYAIVGMLVTDTPLSFNHLDEVALDGGCLGIGSELQFVRQAKTSFRPGDANGWLTSLDLVFDNPDIPDE